MGFLDTIKNMLGLGGNAAPPQQQQSEQHNHSHMAAGSHHGHEEEEQQSSSPGDIAGFNPDRENDFFNAVLHMESEGQYGGTDESRAEIQSRFEIRDRSHWQDVKDNMYQRLSAKYGSFEAVMQMEMNWRQAQMQRAQQNVTASAAASGLLNPVEGITLEKWAAMNAAIVGGANHEDLLRGAAIDGARWQRVSDEWNARMSRDTSFAITTVYGNAFQAASQGKYAAYVKEANAARAANRDVSMAPPVSVEQYFEILHSQSLASNAGKDPVAALKEMGLTIVDFTDLGTFMGYHIHRTWAANIAKYQAEMKSGEAKAAARYPGVKSDLDIQF
jgi:hypothetical protein